MRKGIMLCYPFEESRLTKWGGPPFIVQPKLDGDRCRALIDSEGRATLLSSEENIINSVPHINLALEALHLRNVELDGELYVHGAPHEDIHSIVSREVNLHENSKYMEYHIFDIVDERKQQYYRLQKLNNLFELLYPQAVPRYNNPLVKVQYFVAHNLEDIMNFLSYFTDLKYEGIVVRHPLAPYMRKRATTMMKFKPRKEDSYEVVGWQQEQDKDGNLKQSLGALICRGDDDTRFNVGSGSLLTRENRIKLWEDREKLVGMWADVKYQHLTTKGRVPRFPVIVNLKDGVKL